MFYSIFGGGKIDSRDVDLILTCLDVLELDYFASLIDSNLKLKF
jgi:hypothetical protein